MKTIYRAGGLLMLALLLLGLDTAVAQTVRGQLLRPDGNHPAAYVQVRLLTPDYEPCTPWLSTEQDGMYYFLNVDPGVHLLEVKREGKASLYYKIEVLRQDYTDIQPITLTAATAAVLPPDRGASLRSAAP